MEVKIKIPLKTIKAYINFNNSRELRAKSFDARKKLNLQSLQHDLKWCKTLEDFQKLQERTSQELNSRLEGANIDDSPIYGNEELVNCLIQEFEKQLKPINGRAAAHTFNLSKIHWFVDGAIECINNGGFCVVTSGDPMPKAYFKKGRSVKRNIAVFKKIGANIVLTDFELKEFTS